MKKILLFTLVLVLLLGFSVQALASGEIRVYVDGEEVDFPDQQPYVDENDRTLVPVRFVSQALGANVDWNEKKLEVDVQLPVKNKDIKLWIGKKEYTLNGTSQLMDTKAIITDQDRTMVPLRFVSEGLGAVVKWEIVKGNGIVHNFTLDQTDEEIKAIMDKVRSEIEGEEPKYSQEELQKYADEELVDSEMKLFKRGDDSKVDLSLAILMHKPLEPQWDDVEKLLF
ncbi:MAG: copper amine oxidase N-terminal domain-containing protein, partial [Clostridia bacterium]|nr:copper amine oxidase N-terminal domain-containing protein [Clostridia bacterium]